MRKVAVCSVLLLGITALTWAATPTLTLTPDYTCYTTNGGTVIVDIIFTQTATADEILGGQFFLSFNNNKLTWVSSAVGEAPFAQELYQAHDQGAGTVDFAVGLPLSSAPGYSGLGPIRMARITFEASGEVCTSDLVTFRTTSPYVTRLTKRAGSSAEPLTPSAFNSAAFQIDWTAPSASQGTIATCYPDAASANAAALAATTNLTDTCGTATKTILTGAGSCDTSIVVRVADACGNHADFTYTTRIDGTAPTFTCPVGSDLGCNPATLPSVASVKALVTDLLDNCDPAPTLDCVAGTITGGCQKSQTFTLTASDACGNTSAPGHVTYTWTADTAAPTFTCPTGSDLGCNPATLPTAASVKVLVTDLLDNCDPAPTLDCVAGAITGDCQKSQTFTLTASDHCGNASAACHVTYTWTADTSAPTFTCPTGGNLGCNPTGLPTVDSVKALVTNLVDNCDPSPTLNCVAGAVTGACQKSQTFTLTATDHCGNASAPCYVTYTWTADMTAPIVTAPDDILSNADVRTCSAVLDVGVAQVTDGCSTNLIPTATRSDHLALSAPYPVGTTTITWTATDACGNHGSDTQTVTVRPFNDFIVSMKILGLAPPSGGATRCIKFTFQTCGAGSPVVISRDVGFDENGEVNSALFSGEDGIACTTDEYTCITAEDELHTLRARGVVFADLVENKYALDFTGTYALPAGDYYDDNLIDIADFGVFIAQWGQDYGTGDTYCGTAAPNADANGDGVVDSSDFVPITANFLRVGAEACCTTPFAAPQPRTTITVAELYAAGVDLAWRADLNGDGVIDMTDVELFVNGVVPPNPGGPIFKTPRPGPGMQVIGPTQGATQRGAAPGRNR